MVNHNIYSLNVLTRCSAAQYFVETFYPSLNDPKSRPTIKNFYVKPNPTSPLKPDISINGNIIADVADLQEVLERADFRAHYEVQSFDCQVLNTNYNVGVPDNALGPDKDGKKMSIMVLVSGSVKYWNEGPMPQGDEGLRGFTETIILVPNREAQNPRAPNGEKKWLIQGQTFRLVV